MDGFVERDDGMCYGTTAGGGTTASTNSTPTSTTGGTSSTATTNPNAGHVRFVHMGYYEMDPIDIHLTGDSTPLNSTPLYPGESSDAGGDYTEIEEGFYTADVRHPNLEVLVSHDLDIFAGNYYTVAYVRLAGDNYVIALDDRSPVPAGFHRLTLISGAGSHSSVTCRDDYYTVPSSACYLGANYGEFVTMDIPAGTTNLEIDASWVDWNEPYDFSDGGSSTVYTADDHIFIQEPGQQPVKLAGS